MSNTNTEQQARATQTTSTPERSRHPHVRPWAIASLLLACASTGCVVAEEDSASTAPPLSRAEATDELCDGGDLQNAPPSFAHIDGQAVFVDLCSVETNLELDTATARARVSATVVFYQAEPGYPIIELVPEIDALAVDARLVADTAAGWFGTVTGPNRATEHSVIQVPLQPGRHVARFEYLLPNSETLAFTRFGTVDFYAELSDTEPRGHLERYFPTNLAYDTYAFDLHVEVTGEAKHTVFTNGRLIEKRGNVADISLPAFSNGTLPHLHIAPAEDYTVLRSTYAGLEGDIALTVYRRGACPSRTSDGWCDVTAVEALAHMKDGLARFEAEYGAYPEPAMVLQLVPESPESDYVDVDGDEPQP